MRWTALLIFLFQGCSLFAAETWGLDSRIYPAKEVYILGEPIFLNIEIVNNSSSPVEFENTYGECFFGGITNVPDAKRRSSGISRVPGCHYGEAPERIDSSCAFGTYTLNPGEKHVGMLFLGGLFSFDHAGDYRVQAQRRIGIGHGLAGSFEAASDFEIKVVQGTEDQLRTAFEPYVQDLSISLFNSANLQRYNNAVAAIITMAPPFLEDIILRLSKAWMIGTDTISALGSLNTERTIKRLAEIANRSDDVLPIMHRMPAGLAMLDSISKSAVLALAQTRNPAALDVLKRIGNMKDHPARSDAIQTLGLFGEVAIPYLTTALKDPQTKHSAVQGLGVTGSRAAVPILIDLLEKSDNGAMIYARESLAQLTHLVIDSSVDPGTPHPSEYRRWLDWWALNGATAEIFDTDHCSELAPLP